MPLFAEIGPLELDPEMQTDVEKASSLILDYEAQDLL